MSDAYDAWAHEMLADYERDRQKLKAELAQAVKERDEAVQLLYLLDKPEARHPDVAAFLDALEYTRK